MRRELLQKIPFKAKVVIASGQLPKEQLANLEKGDVLLFEEKTKNAATILIENQPIFKGTPGFFKGYKAVKIE